MAKPSSDILLRFVDYAMRSVTDRKRRAFARAPSCLTVRSELPEQNC